MAESRPLRVLCLDGGDSRAMSQLYILQELMHRVEHKTGKKVLPCEFFDLITGIDSSSPIAAFLGLFRMSVEDAQQSFYEIYTAVFVDESYSPEGRAQRLDTEIRKLMDTQNIPHDTRLSDPSFASTCKVALCYSSSERMDHCNMFRNYRTPQQASQDVTVIDAIRASWATPGLLPAASVGPEGREEQLVSAVNGFGNPIQEVIKEAYHVFGPNARIGCLLSLGTGYRGALSLNGQGDATVALGTRMTTDCEVVAEEIYRRFARLGVYYRLSVDHGLEGWSRFGVGFGSMKSHVDAYLAKKEQSSKLDRCITTSVADVSLVSLEQLYGSKAQGLRSAHGLPPLSAYFVTRRKPMEAMIRGLIEGSGAAQRIMIVSGLGGSGKTQLALKFARDFRDSYQHILFIDASSSESIQKGLISRVQSISPNDRPTTAEEAIDILSNPDENVTKDWFIVFDNADNPQVSLVNYLPSCDHGSILITTRDPSLGELSPDSHLELGNMDEDEAVEVLLSAAFPAGNLSSDTTNPQTDETDSLSRIRDREAATAISRELGYLPIAMVQAGCFIKQHKGLHQYLDRLRTNRSYLLNRATRIHRDKLRYPHGVYASFDIALQALSPRAVHLLGVLSFFHFAEFPRPLFANAAKSQFKHECYRLLDRPPAFDETVQFLMFILSPSGEWKEDDLDQILEELQRYSLVSLVPIHNIVTLRFHPLVHGWARDRMSDEEQDKHRAAAVRLFVCGITEDDDFIIGEYLLPHLPSFWPVIDSLHVNDRAAISKLVGDEGDADKYMKIWSGIVPDVEAIHGRQHMRSSRARLLLADAYYKSGDMERMEAMEREVVETNQRILGHDHIETLASRSNLARSMRIAQRFNDAAEMEKEILRARIRTLGLNHRETAHGMMDLAATLHCLVQYKDEQGLLLGAVAIRTKVLGPSALATIASLNELAECHHVQGQLVEMERLQKEVLALRQKLHGEQHLNTVAAMMSLAQRYHEQGRHEESEALRRVEVDTRIRMQGDRELQTLIAMHWLARSRFELKRYADAAQGWREVLAGRQELHGEQHAETLNAMHWLARTYFEMKRYAEAEEWWRKELAARRELHDENHPDILLPLHWLARVCLEQKRYEESVDLWRQELEGRLRRHGERHTETLNAKDWLARPLLELKRFEEAATLWEEVLAGRIALQGEKHRDVLNAKDWLGRSRFELKEYDKAEVLWKDVLEGRRELLGNYSKDTLNAMDWLGSCYYETKQYADAEILWRGVLEGRRELFGDRHKDVISAMGWHAAVLMELKQYDEAKRLRLEQIEGSRKVFGDLDENTLKALGGLSNLVIRQDKYAEAEPILREVLKGRRALHGEIHETTLLVLHWLGRCLFEQKKWEGAEELWRDELKGITELHGARHADTLLATEWLGRSVFEQRKLEEAETLFTEVLEGRKEVLEPPHEDICVAMNWLAKAKFERRELKAAEALWKEEWETRKGINGEKDMETVKALGWLATSVNDQGRYLESSRLWKKELELRRELEGSMNTDTLTSVANLASAYYGQWRYPDAILLFREEYEGRKQLQGRDHADTLEAMYSLAMTYYQEHRYDKARDLFVEELVMRRDQKNALLTARSADQLGRTYRALNRNRSAIESLREAASLRSQVLEHDDPVLLNTIELCNLIALHSRSASRVAVPAASLSSSLAPIVHTEIAQEDGADMEMASGPAEGQGAGDGELPAPDPGGDPSFVPQPVDGALKVPSTQPRAPFALRAMFSTRPNSWMISADFLATCIVAAREYHCPTSSTESDFLELDLDDDSASGSISKAEAMFYYSGLYSSPKLVYRTGPTPWTMPTGPEAYRVLKELRPVFGHKLNIVWKDLGPKICELLDSHGVLWTTIDVVRFIKVRPGEVVGPVVLWIGVPPETLSGEDARTSASGCLGLLKEFNITDVEVEYRESIYTRSAGPDLLKHVSDFNPTVDVRDPLTPALGLFIAAWATPHAEGTGGLYLAEGGDSKKILLVTARHVLFPPNQGPNVDYAHTNTSARRRNVLLLGTKAFENLVTSIKVKIGGHGIMVEIYNRWIEELQAKEAGEDQDDVAATGRLMEYQRLLDKTNEEMEALEKFYNEVKKNWRQPKHRVLGHIVRSPPVTLGAGTEGFTEDYAIVELDSSKIEKVFKGNVIDLGTKIPLVEFTMKMRPRTDATTTFKYPTNRLLKLEDIMSEDLMQNPDMVDDDDEPCPLVIKNGNATGVTIGRANGIFSYVREYFNNGTHSTSMEWAILPDDHKSGVFSALGDSGSIIADSRGRIGGLLTGGAGERESLDITYATPFFWLFPRIKKNGFPNAHIYPFMA